MMAEQAGQSGDAVAARLSELSQRHDALADADRQLAAAVADAHAVTVEALARLDDIEQQIESAVTAHDSLALDTGAGAREWQRFLLGKQHEIVTVVTEASDRASAKTTALQRLLDSYRGSGELSTD